MAFLESSQSACDQKTLQKKFFKRNFGFVCLILMTSLTAGSGADVDQTLSCGHHCSCGTSRTPGNEPKYEVFCFAPEGKDWILNKGIFSNSSNTYNGGLVTVKVNASITGAGRVFILESFLRAWRGFKTSTLELKDIGDLSFERHNPASNGIAKYQSGQAVVTINKCHVDLLPGGLFHSKAFVGLNIVSSTVAVIDRGLLYNVGAVDHFHIRHSHVGILRGPISALGVTVRGSLDDLEAVILENSRISILEKHSLVFSAVPHNECRMKFNWVNVGIMEREAIVVRDFAFVHFENNFIMDIHREGLTIKTSRSKNLVNNTPIAPGDETSDFSYCGHGAIVRKNILMVPDTLFPKSPGISEKTVSESSCLSNSIFISRDSLLHPRVPENFLTEMKLVVFILMALSVFLLTLIAVWVTCYCCSTRKSWSPRQIPLRSMTRLAQSDDSLRNTFARFQAVDLTSHVTENQQQTENAAAMKSDVIPCNQTTTTEVSTTNTTSVIEDSNGAELKESTDVIEKPSEEIQEPSDEDSIKNMSEISSVGETSSKKINEESAQRLRTASKDEENSSKKTSEDVVQEVREASSVEENSSMNTSEDLVQGISEASSTEERSTQETTGIVKEESLDHKAEYSIDDSPLSEDVIFLREIASGDDDLKNTENITSNDDQNIVFEFLMPPNADMEV